MAELLVIAALVGAIAFIHSMWKIDKERRDREKGYDDAVRREKQNRMRSFGGEDFWKDPKKDPKKDEDEDED